jgi:hypothetical protein
MERVNEGEYGGCIFFIYENRRMKLVEIFLGKWGEGRGRMMKGVNLRYTVSTL